MNLLVPCNRRGSPLSYARSSRSKYWTVDAGQMSLAGAVLGFRPGNHGIYHSVPCGSAQFTRVHFGQARLFDRVFLTLEDLASLVYRKIVKSP